MFMFRLQISTAYLTSSISYFFKRVLLLKLTGLLFFQLEAVVEVVSILGDAEHVVPELGGTISPFCYFRPRLCLLVPIATSLWELGFYWSHHGYLGGGTEKSMFSAGYNDKIARALSAVISAYNNPTTLEDLPHHQRDTVLEEGGVHTHKSIQTSSPGFAPLALLLEEVSQADGPGASAFSSCGHSSKLMACSFQDQTAVRI